MRRASVADNPGRLHPDGGACPPRPRQVARPRRARQHLSPPVGRDQAGHRHGQRHWRPIHRGTWRGLARGRARDVRHSPAPDPRADRPARICRCRPPGALFRRGSPRAGGDAGRPVLPAAWRGQRSAASLLDRAADLARRPEAPRDRAGRQFREWLADAGQPCRRAWLPRGEARRHGARARGGRTRSCRVHVRCPSQVRRDGSRPASGPGRRAGIRRDGGAACHPGH